MAERLVALEGAVVVDQMGTYYFQLRSVVVDGKAGPLINQALDLLCSSGWYTGHACEPTLRLLSYETTDGGTGWYYFHHNHMHVSSSGVAPTP